MARSTTYQDDGNVVSELLTHTQAISRESYHTACQTVEVRLQYLQNFLAFPYALCYTCKAARDVFSPGIILQS